MFNANAGRQASTQQIEARSDRFAANIEDRLKELTLTEQEALMDRLDAVVAGTDTARSFAAGTYAQDSSGQPARALGGGSSNSGSSGGNQPSNEQEALDVLIHSPALSDGVRHALRRLLNPRDPNPIAVENDGTPADVKALQKELRDERDDSKPNSLAGKLKKAQQELADERDDSKNGSLAKKLADAQAAAATPADVVRKDEMNALADEALTAVNNISAPMGVKVKGKDAAKAKVQAIKDKAS